LALVADLVDVDVALVSLMAELDRDERAGRVGRDRRALRGIGLHVERRDPGFDHAAGREAVGAGSHPIAARAAPAAPDGASEPRGEQQVAGGAARAVDVEVEPAKVARVARIGHARTASRAMRTAATAAPTPLSMLTTVMPGAHEDSSAPSATRPSSETPYPT